MAKKKRKFTYKARSAESNKRRADQKGNKFASIFKENLQTFSTQDDNRIRIFPAGWDEAEHYGIDIYVHYGIGPDNQQFLCRKEMGKGSCPICEERQSNLASDPDYAFKLKATHRVAIWLLDRNDRKAGPKLWAMPWTVDRDVSQLAQDEDNGEVLPIDHPDDGYDVLFSMEGPKGGMKKYIGLKISRKPCAISKKESRQEEWLDFITENQVLDCLNYYSEEHITGCFGASIPDDDEEDANFIIDQGDELMETFGLKSRLAKTLIVLIALMIICVGSAIAMATGGVGSGAITTIEGIIVISVLSIAFYLGWMSAIPLVLIGLLLVVVVAGIAAKGMLGGG